jgi:hypothetical protein
VPAAIIDNVNIECPTIVGSGAIKTQTLDFWMRFRLETAAKHAALGSPLC